MRLTHCLLLPLLCVLPWTTQAENAQPLTVNTKILSLETALKMAQAAIHACREAGIQIGVTVMDRSGHPQVVLRDVLAPDLTLTVSRQKAYTAVSFKAATQALEDRFKTPFAVGKIDGLVMSAGGLPIEAGGILYGGIGVSGASSGLADEKCAQAGLDAVLTDLEMAD